MPLEIKDLVGLSEPLKKLVESCSAGVGTLWRPRSIRNEADAKAYEIKAIERAKVEAEIDGQALQFQATQDRIAQLAEKYPDLAARAKQRLLTREIEGQLNVEQIAEHAALALPAAVSNEPVSADWRRKFFQEAENVCEVDMQELWGKVLAGEVTQPGSFSLRTLETLKQLSKHEAELFRTVCRLAMDDGSVALPSSDINTALKPYGITYDVILQLRDAGLVQNGDHIHRNYGSQFGPEEQQCKLILRNNGIFIELSGASLRWLNQPSLVLTQSGRELQRLIGNDPNDAYLSAYAASMRERGIVAKRGAFVPQDEDSALLVFEQDL